MLKSWLRNWLGYIDLEQELCQAMTRLQETIEEISRQNAEYVRYQRIINRALGKIIVKVDPIYVEDELSPKRKAASDALAEQVIEKLKSEQYESTKLTGGR